MWTLSLIKKHNMKKLLFIALFISALATVSAQTSIEVDAEKDKEGQLIRWTVTTDLTPYTYYVVLNAVPPTGSKKDRHSFILTWSRSPYGQFYLPVTTKYDFYFDIRNAAGEIVYTQKIKNSEIRKVDDIWEY